jgi:hypothetical protein
VATLILNGRYQEGHPTAWGRIPTVLTDSLGQTLELAADRRPRPGLWVYEREVPRDQGPHEFRGRMTRHV